MLFQYAVVLTLMGPDGSQDLDHEKFLFHICWKSSSKFSLLQVSSNDVLRKIFLCHGPEIHQNHHNDYSVYFEIVTDETGQTEKRIVVRDRDAHTRSEEYSVSYVFHKPQGFWCCEEIWPNNQSMHTKPMHEAILHGARGLEKLFELLDAVYERMNSR